MESFVVVKVEFFVIKVVVVVKGDNRRVGVGMGMVVVRFVVIVEVDKVGDKVFFRVNV